ncbi:AfsR/SARP family transcriptional regulator [Micromonospora sp. HM5-17]|uniref:AfsR/SARP family transcriptional regulator n=1 Tax=Micromonospora sp. HM5-17 TaxID=2487710 RepID=UPI000F4AE2A6|nr:AfsR/SARP family transcriptional regulator [Micromonospora sp. HM5-17]ROT26785.1 hypothetical protein EF879_24450 [Micromonospora sp. HM5-17]
MGSFHVAVLGPLRVEVDGTHVRLGPRLTTLLSMLLVVNGQAVPASRLVRLLWGDEAPAAATVTLRSHISHLRRALSSGRPGNAAGILRTVGSGAGTAYRLDLPDDHLDVRRFERDCLAGQRLLAGGTADLVERAAVLLGEALALWRGPAYADVADQPFAVSEIARLDALRRTAQRHRVEALARLGRHAEVLGEVIPLVHADPYDEGLRRLLVLALYQEQRVDEALRVSQEGLRLLHDRGLEAPHLQELHQAVLRRAAAVPGSPAAPRTPVPSLLPPDPPRFVGRVAELARARRVLATQGAGPALLLVTGPVGIGKTSFAVRLGHLVADWFPDGQLYVNLRGFDPAGTAMPVGEAVRVFLDALGVPVQRIPATVEAQVARYRDLVAGRRILVILDNARDVDQIRPLLPAARGCAVVVTSRNQMPGLVAADGAHPVVLGQLSAADARALLHSRLDAPRLAAEPAAVDEIIDSCARLPLALALVAARAATHPDFRLAELAQELRGARGVLDAFSGTDGATDLRQALSGSYHALRSAAARQSWREARDILDDLQPPDADDLRARLPER